MADVPAYRPVRTLYFTEQGLERYRHMLQAARTRIDEAGYQGNAGLACQIANSVCVAAAAMAGLGGYVTADLNHTDLYCVQTDGPLHYGVNVASHDGTWSVNS